MGLCSGGAPIATRNRGQASLAVLLCIPQMLTPPLLCQWGNRGTQPYIAITHCPWPRRASALLGRLQHTGVP